MTMKMLAISVIVLSSGAGISMAQDSTVTGAAGGAVTGAIVGGPVGAAVGGVVGAIVGTAVQPPPPTVVTYVREQPLPQTVIVIEQPIAVGDRLPSEIVLMPIPDNPTYAYAVINEQRVIVDPVTYVIVGVVQ